MALDQNAILSFKSEIRFRKYDNRPLIIFRFDGEIYVIDNNDPVGFDKDLYTLSRYYFVTNKLIGNELYQSKKIIPLYPHYPINSLNIYIRLFNFNLIRYLSLVGLLKMIKTFLDLPIYKSQKRFLRKKNSIFFSSRIWSKEMIANQIRASFISYCKKDERFEFEGGFRPRNNGDNFGHDSLVSKKKYTPKQFSRLSKRSVVVLNNPAVLGALSWRFAEYLNYGLFILNFPFKIQLPKDLVHAKNIYGISLVEEIPQVLDMIIEYPQCCDEIARGGKDFFEDYCAPQKQWDYIKGFLVSPS